jgi:hypothetical protein
VEAGLVHSEDRIAVRIDEEGLRWVAGQPDLAKDAVTGVLY